MARADLVAETEVLEVKAVVREEEEGVEVPRDSGVAGAELEEEPRMALRSTRGTYRNRSPSRSKSRHPALRNCRGERLAPRTPLLPPGMWQRWL